MQDYFTQQQIKHPLCYLAELFLWMNGQQSILSAANIDILKNKIDKSGPAADLVSMDSFIRE